MHSEGSILKLLALHQRNLCVCVFVCSREANHPQKPVVETVTKTMHCTVNLLPVLSVDSPNKSTHVVLGHGGKSQCIASAETVFDSNREAQQTVCCFLFKTKLPGYAHTFLAAPRARPQAYDNSANTVNKTQKAWQPRQSQTKCG